MATRYNIADMTWVEYEARLQHPGNVLLLPISATAQHGWHLPLGCDAIIGTAIAEHVAQVIGGMVAPSVSYGYKSLPRTGGGDHFPGNIPLDGKTITSIITDLLLEFVRHGARNIVVLDSHYENHWFIVEGIEDTLVSLKRLSIFDVKIVKFRYDEMSTQATLDKVFGGNFMSWEREHAAVMTTSILLHLCPELVNMSAAPDHAPILYPPYDKYPFDLSTSSPSGVLSAATSATAVKGKLLFDEYVERISDSIRSEFGLSQQ